jgi:hypothetical protein
LLGLVWAKAAAQKLKTTKNERARVEIITRGYSEKGLNRISLFPLPVNFAVDATSEKRPAAVSYTNDTN